MGRHVVDILNEVGCAQAAQVAPSRKCSLLLIAYVIYMLGLSLVARSLFAYHMLRSSDGIVFVVGFLGLRVALMWVRLG